MDPATPLRNLPVAVVDFETTDLPDNDPHVVDVAVVHVTLGADDARVAFASRVRPPVPIPAKATSIHGIGDADVAESPAWLEVSAAVAQACAGRVIVAFNAPADFTFWKTEESRLGLEGVPWPWLDLLVVRKATKTRGRPGKLAEIAGEYGIVLDAHGATGDALTTALLLTPLMRAAWGAGAFNGAEGAQPRRWNDYDDPDEDGAPPVRVETWGAFVAWQRSAALYQERDFCAYVLRTGGLSRPSCGWHAIEGVEPPAWPSAVRTAPCPSCRAATVRKVGKDGGTYLAHPETGALHAC
jgi:DNA polymerase III epsilon subunit-like protein